MKKILDIIIAWYTSSYVSIYFKWAGVSPTGPLKNAIEEKNFKALKYIKYTIKFFRKIPGVHDSLNELASINTPGNNGERIYRNKLTEFHAVYFLHKTLNHAVEEVESRMNKISSPNSNPNKYCDIKSTHENQTFYFEVKDSSSEIMTRHQQNGLTFYTPIDDDRLESWLKNQAKEADNCGASYLICRIPVWLNDASQTSDFNTVWFMRVFRNLFTFQSQPSITEIVVSPQFKVSSNLKGFYIIKAFGYMKVTFS